MVASSEPLVAGQNTQQPPPENGFCARWKRRCRCCSSFCHKVNDAEDAGQHGYWHKCFVWSGIVCFFWVLIRGIIQFSMFHYATIGCSADHLENYNYPGGGWNCPRNTEPGNENYDHCIRGPAENVVPGTALLLERAPSTWGQKYEVYHATEGNAQIDRAPVGSWWRTWGPWFWTYTYEDVENSQTSLYMRPTVVGMAGLMSSSRIMRCDGQGDAWFFGEGSNWFSNRIRSTFNMQRESSFKIYHGSARIATALETFHGTKSIIFKDYPDAHQMGSAVLVENSGHQHDLWSCHLSDSVNETSIIPFYVMNAATVLMAYKWRNIRHDQGIRAGDRGTQPAFLMERSDASAGFHEETDDSAEGSLVEETANPVKMDSDVVALDGDASTQVDEKTIEKVDA